MATVMQITTHFKDYEFACKDGTLVPEKLRGNMQLLANQLEIIRLVLNEPVYINSAYRTSQHNFKVGGVSRSFHLKCMASDVRCHGATPTQVYNTILKLMDDGLIIPGGLKKYSTFVHYDIRGVKVLF